MKRWMMFLLFTSSIGLFAQNLPTWAETALSEFDKSKVPASADVVKIWDKTKVTLNEGKRRIYQQHVYMVLKEPGVGAAESHRVQVNQKTRKLTTFKGWHRNARNQVQTLAKRDTVSINLSSSVLTSDMAATTGFDLVAPGSVVAWETEVDDTALIPFQTYHLWENIPVYNYSLHISGEQPFQLRKANLDAEGLQLEVSDNSVTAAQLPVYRGGSFGLTWRTRPRVTVIPEGKDGVYFASWDSLATWYLGRFRQVNNTTALNPAQAADPLNAMAKDMADRITYRQRYLNPDRGWIPESGSVVARRGYGDCKDMVACAAHLLTKQQIEVFPVLANISDESYATVMGDSAGPYFNHLIAAIPLSQSLGFKSEVSVGGQTYLLYDPTSRATALGSMPAYYRGMSVMICTDSGAKWVEVPDSSLVQEGITFSLEGELNNENTVKGTLTITEWGNAEGLASIAGSSNAESLEWAVRGMLDMPAVVTIAPKDAATREGEKTTLSYTVTWPGFLRRDLDGLRLYRGLVPWYVFDLDDGGDLGQQSVALPAIAPTAWKINLKTATPLQPAGESYTWTEGDISFNWKAQGGEQLVIEYSRQRGRVAADATQMEALLADWERYREAYSEFTNDFALLRYQ